MSVRGALRRLLRGRVGMWYHPSFRVPIAGLEARLGIDPRRADNVLTWALNADVVAEADVFEANEAPWSVLRPVHDEAWLERLDDPRVVGRVLATDPRLLRVGAVVEMWRRGVGASVDGFAWALEHEARAVSLGGGFHHAFPAHGAGFCGLNDVAAAVVAARKQGFGGRIGIIDLDAHPPDGVAACLATDPAVSIASLAVEGAFEAVPGIVDTRLPQGTRDETYLAALDVLLHAFPKVDALIYIAGADPLVGDRFGAMAVTEEGLRERDRRVFHHFGAIPCLVLPAGGYTPGAWRVFAGTVAEAAGSSVTVRPGFDPLLVRTRQIFRQLDPHALSGEDDWLSDADLGLALGYVPPQDRRFLGHYTRAGMEYALSRYGLFANLARMGFDGLRLELRTDEEPHQLWVFADVDGKEERLIDLSLSIRAVHDFKTLFVEWLSMRDPRVPFSPGRPRLPGQEAPGLGLAADVTQLLVRMAERLDLAGICLVPAHYHIAWMLRDRYVMVEPEARGRFLAIQRHLESLPLADATRLLAERGLDTESGERVFWNPAPMVLPLHASLRERLAVDDAEAEEIAAALTDNLIPRAP